MTLYFVQCVKEGRTVWRILAQNPMELGARLGKPCNKILRNLIHVHKYVLAYACVYVARCQRMLQALRYIIRKSKFPQNPKRSVRFSGKRTKRSVQKRKARNTQKAETKVL